MCCVSPYLWCALPFSFCTLSVVIYELIYLWYISDGMLRGSSKRSYRTRSRKRRRYSSRRRTYRSYRRKRSRLSLDERMRIVAVKNATSSRRQYGWIARDLGHLLPDCLSVKLFQKFYMDEVGRPDISNDNGGQNWYQNYIVCYPAAPFASWNSGTFFATVASGSTVGSVPLGWSRLVGSSSSSLYRRALCISVAVDIRVTTVPLFHNLNVPGVVGLERLYPPWRHFLTSRTNGSGDPLLMNPASNLNLTQDTFDNVMAQPETRVQHSIALAHGSYNQLTAEVAVNEASWNTVPCRPTRWRTVVWPHRVLGKPFSQYLGDHSNCWGTGLANPTESVVLWIGGAAAGIQPHPGGATIFGGTNTSNYATSFRVLFEVDLAFSIICKIPNVGLS